MTALPFTFEALEGDARVGVRSSAASRAEEILAHARIEAAELLEAAREQGFAEGYATGREQVMAELEPTRQALLSVVEELAARQQELAAQGEAFAVDLGLRIADKVVATALDVRPELVLSVVTGALRRVSDRSSVVLEVHPDDLDSVQASIGDIAGGLGGFPSLDVVAERRVGRGGCTVRLDEGEIGACVDEQLARAAEIVREALAA